MNVHCRPHRGFQQLMKLPWEGGYRSESHGEAAWRVTGGDSGDELSQPGHLHAEILRSSSLCQEHIKVVHVPLSFLAFFFFYF